ncbi:MAG: AzlC family ABC transporter permease [Steroidobacterales bacterium]
MSAVIVWRGAAARDAFRAGYTDIAPAIPATMAWGLVTGVAMAQSGLSLAQAYGLAVLAFAGSAQLAVLPLLTSHAPVIVTVLTALIVNLRFVIYSAAMKSDFLMLPFSKRLGLAYLIGDFPFVLFTRRGPQCDPSLRPVYFFGIGLCNLVVWHIGSFAGLLVAGSVPAEWGLDFAGMVALVALLVPMLANRAGLAACAVGGGVGILLDGVPAHAGLVPATLAGIAAALLAEQLPRRLR